MKPQHFSHYAPQARYGIPLMLMLVAAMLIGVVWVVEKKQMLLGEEQEWREVIKARSFSLGATLSDAIREGHTDDLADLMGSFGAEPNLEVAILLDDQGKVLASTRLGLVGQAITQLKYPEVLAMREVTLGALRGVTQLSPDRNDLWAGVPVIMGASKDPLRPDAIGVFVVKYDLSSQKAQVLYALQGQVGIIAAMIVLISLLIALLTHLLWTRRILHLVDAAQNFGVHDLRVRSGVRGSDEIGKIGRAFDAMADKVAADTIQLQKLVGAIEQLAEAVIITDSQGHIEYTNPSFTAITGYSAKEVLGHNPRILKSGQHKDSFYQQMWATIASGKVWSGQVIDRRKNGELYNADITISPILDEHGTILNYVGIQQDVTERVRLESELERAHKMEVLGTLVGGIAHEFNNILAGMLGNLYLIKKRLDGDEEGSQKVKNVEKLGYRAADMIRQLLAFSRQENVSMHPLYLRQAILETYEMVRSGVPTSVDFKLDLCEKDSLILGDESQLQQIILNLLTNAVAATREVAHPSIILMLKEVSGSLVMPDLPRSSQERYFCLSVSDNGVGMSQEVQERIFDPFYTTKKVGEGTGLGMAMVYGLVEQLQGSIEVISAPDQGTEIQVLLPIVSDSLVQMVKEKSDSILAHGDCTILVVDDEEAVSQVSEAILRAFGYDVLHAGNGQEAVQVFAEYRDRIALVIMDVAMPVMGGVEAAKNIRAQVPGLPLVFTTGYDRYEVLKDVWMEDATILAKPVHPERLLQVVGELLG